MCGDLLKELNSMRPTGMAYLLTSDESWFFHDNPHQAKWATDSASAGTRPLHTIGSTKTLVVVFWSFTGFFYLDVVPDGTRYNSDFITENLIPGIEGAISESRPIIGLSKTKLHWDNARPHSSAKTRNVLENKNIILLPHPRPFHQM